jgi:hypothetical protein
MHPLLSALQNSTAANINLVNLKRRHSHVSRMRISANCRPRSAFQSLKTYVFLAMGMSALSYRILNSASRRMPCTLTHSESWSRFRL